MRRNFRARYDVNALAILCRALLGMLLRRLKEDYKQIVFHGVSLAVLFIGASGAIGNMIQPSSHPILFIISLIIGGLLGQWWNIELRLENLGNLIQSKLQKGSKGGNLSQGFVSASLLLRRNDGHYGVFRKRSPGST